MPTSIEWTDERWNLADGVSEECCDLCYADPAEHGEQQFRRERLRKLADPIKRITQGDLNFFAAFPHRRYRVGEADCAEIEQAQLLGADMSLPPGKQYYNAVRYLTPDTCLRVAVLGPPDADPELFDEETAREIFKQNATLKSVYLAQDVYLTQAEILGVIEALK